jgi:hypothetical protein
MVNYDLPWNPNRLEQRFGRIHRIGQTEVCHYWNLVASKTREGDVYRRLLVKLEEERKALGGKVFDILGKLLFGDKPLRNLLMEAIRYGDRPEVRDRLNQVVDNAMDREKHRGHIQENALAQDSMDASRVQRFVKPCNGPSPSLSHNLLPPSSMTLQALVARCAKETEAYERPMCPL